MADEEKKQYTGRGGYHGGGRKKTGLKRISISISGQPEEIARLKELAKAENSTVTDFILRKTGIRSE